jgi:hypothetical protein
MNDHYTGINEYLTYDQRCELIKDICTVYHYGYERKKELHMKSDDNLFAYREDLRQRGKIPRFLTGSFSVHLSVFLKKFGANSYEIDTKWEGMNLHTIVYIGLCTGEFDRFGIEKKYQLGYIQLDNNWKIVKVEMYGDTMKRYNGLELIIDGKK